MAGASVFGLAESDSEDELPAGWEERTTLDGKVYYVSHDEKTTQWNHPRTGKKKTLLGDLPPGWQRQELEDGKIVFINHDERKTTYTDPRLAFAREETGDRPRQKFDASSKAEQVLHGVDLAGLSVLLTGANSGIGLETARCLAIHNAHVVLACRDLRAADRARQLILAEKTTAKVDLLECDLSNLHSVRQCARAYIAHGWQLHVLILNAAIFAADFCLTPDTSLELTLATNHLGHFYLTRLLTPVLQASAPARVVVLSSESHRQVPLFQSLSAESLTLEKLSPDRPSKYWYLHAYNLSKVCNILFAFELNRRLYSQKITCNALHPGNMIWTNLARRSCVMRVLFALARPFTKSRSQGAATSVFCAVAPELEGLGGHYFNNCWFCPPSAQAQDLQLQTRLWELSDEIIQRFEASSAPM